MKKLGNNVAVSGFIIYDSVVTKSGNIPILANLELAEAEE
jgi:hypothetical protein